MTRSQKLINEVQYLDYCSQLDSLDEGFFSDKIEKIKEVVGAAASTSKKKVTDALKLPQLYKKLSEFEAATKDFGEILDKIIYFIENDKQVFYDVRKALSYSNSKIGAVKKMVGKVAGENGSEKAATNS